MAVLGAVDMARASHRTAPIRYAKDENAVFSGANSRVSKSCRVLGSGISCWTGLDITTHAGMR